MTSHQIAYAVLFGTHVGLVAAAFLPSSNIIVGVLELINALIYGLMVFLMLKTIKS